MNDEKNDFALVPRPPSALEKAEPGAKRILSGMVTDTLALVKKEQAAKTVFSAATCGGPLTAEALQTLIGSPLQKILGNSYAVELNAFEYGDELLGAPGNFDLIFVLRWPYSPLISLEKGKPNPHKFIAELKTKFGKPIIIVGLESWCRQIAKADLGWQESGTDAYFEVDFSTESESFAASDAFNRAFKTCVAKSLAARDQTERSIQLSAQPHRIRPLRIVMVNDEPSVLQIFEIVIRDWFKDAKVLFFDNGATALEELVQTDPDLLITDDRMAVMGGEELCQRLLDRKASYPIILMSAWETADLLAQVQQFANRGLNLSFLPVPCGSESFLKAVEAALKIKHVATEKPNKLTPRSYSHQPLRTRPPRILILDDEEALRQSYKVLLKGWYDEATILIFDDARRAWEELSHTDPDLFITDIHHPGIDGKEMLERLAKKKVRYPILVISAMASFDDDTLRGWGPGLNVSLLNKPIDAETFQTAVESALQIPTQHAP